MGPKEKKYHSVIVMEMKINHFIYAAHCMETFC